VARHDAKTMENWRFAALRDPASLRSRLSKRNLEILDQ
jgi:hypothetical protein